VVKCLGNTRGHTTRVLCSVCPKFEPAAHLVAETRHTNLVRSRCGATVAERYGEGHPALPWWTGTLHSGVSKAFRATAKMRFELISSFRKFAIGNGEKEGEYTHRSSSVGSRRKSRGRTCRGLRRLG